MSARHLRRLGAAKQALELGLDGLDSDEGGPGPALNAWELFNAPPKRTKKPKSRAAPDAAAAEAGADRDDDDDGAEDRGAASPEEDGGSSAEGPEDEGRAPQPRSPGPARPRKRRPKRPKPAPAPADCDDEALDDLLSRFSGAAAAEGPAAAAAAAAAEPGPAERRRALLECTADHLNPDAETRRLFGRAVADQTARKRPGPRGAGPRFRRSLFTAPDDGWPPWTAHDLRMECVGVTGDGLREYAFVYGPEYQRAQAAFEAAAATHDHNQLYPVLHKYPYHVATLMQLSRFLHMADHLQQSTELLHRALYTMEVTAVSAGFAWLSPGTQRLLPYRHAENQALHEALHSHVQRLTRAGNHRTALEACKVLYSLDPDPDPMHCLLLLDYLCVRASQWAYLQRLYAALEAGGTGVHELPSLQFGTALAAYLQESAPPGPGAPPAPSEAGHEGASARLRHAILMHPRQVVVLLQRCAVLDSDVLTHPLFTDAADAPLFRTLFEIYADRNHELWRRPDVVVWLRAAIARALQDLRGDGALAVRLQVNRRAIHQRPCMRPYAAATADAVLGRVEHLPEDEPEGAAAGPLVPARLRRLVWCPRNPVLLFFATLLPWNTLAVILHNNRS